MADLQVGKKRVGYDQWTQKETSALLELMVDAANRGWRDNSGILTKQIVEERILPALNSRLECNKNYNNYQSRLRWFKNRWLSYSTLLKFNSGFGYDSTSKRFTAPNEVWDEYLKVTYPYVFVHVSTIFFELKKIAIMSNNLFWPGSPKRRPLAQWGI